MARHHDLGTFLALMSERISGVMPWADCCRGARVVVGNLSTRISERHNQWDREIAELPERWRLMERNKAGSTSVLVAAP